MKISDRAKEMKRYIEISDIMKSLTKEQDKIKVKMKGERKDDGLIDCGKAGRFQRYTIMPHILNPDKLKSVFSQSQYNRITTRQFDDKKAEVAIMSGVICLNDLDKCYEDGKPSVRLRIAKGEEE